MKVENAVYPTPDRLKAIADQTTEGPIVMVTLLAWVQRMLWPRAEGDFETWPNLERTLMPLLERQVGRLFERSTHVPLTVLSYGNAEASLFACVRKHRSKVEAHEIRYRHMANRATRENNATNHEFLIVAPA